MLHYIRRKLRVRITFITLQMLLMVLYDTESEDVTDAADQLSVKSKRIFLADSGLVFNSPYPLLIRPQRGCDVLLSFDFSSREREIEMPFEVIFLHPLQLSGSEIATDWSPMRPKIRCSRPEF